MREMGGTKWETNAATISQKNGGRHSGKIAKTNWEAKRETK